MSAQVRALVTGSSGYVAACLLPALRAEGWWLRGLDRQPAPAGAALDEAVVGDLLDPATTERALDGVGTVVHLAAAKSDWGVPEAVYMRDNVDATASLVEAGRRRSIADWIVYSTVGVHGPSAVALAMSRSPWNFGSDPSRSYPTGKDDGNGPPRTTRPQRAQMPTLRPARHPGVAAGRRSLGDAPSRPPAG